MATFVYLTSKLKCRHSITRKKPKSKAKAKAKDTKRERQMKARIKAGIDFEAAACADQLTYSTFSPSIPSHN